ncbi:MAG: hypothetical protein DWQ34_00780 [Planctomycetota bacterium]|nr:MAG: hypothetical protein DWQ34_00780 [Planctomycetota bacterium]REK25623.1 MAG: hypothetical protein DWQ41_11870 [Planctomycetota bacterium]REK31666.1 MAG: hypothetical protein DWQ45_18815 [Planctomycetota bacterium]
MKAQSTLRRIAFLIVLFCLVASPEAFGWGKGHRLIRLWAVARLPEWQREMIGREHLDRLCREYTSLQDQHAGGTAPELDPYCLVPGARLSLHDVNPAEPSLIGMRWYIEQVSEQLAAGETDEAMKFLGVLCHWNEDPGCPSAHSSPVSELQLRRLLPPPKDKQRYNYLFGYGGIADVGSYEIDDVEYQPQLLGTTVDEAAARIYQHQRLLRAGAAAHIVPIVQDMMHGDGAAADEHRAAAALANARHTADVIYTVLCLSAGRVDEEEAEALAVQRLSEWLPEFEGQMIGHPYYVTPFLVDQSMDARRNLHPLALPGTGEPEPVEFGFGMGAPFSLDFTLAPAGVFDRFTCRVGLHPTAGPEGEVAFAVCAGDEELIRTDPIRSGASPQAIDIALPRDETLTLSLKTIPSDQSKSLQNLAVWAEPTLHRAKTE